MMEEMVWQPISTAPRNATDVYVRMSDGTIYRAHWACDLSGEDQPSYKGWFTTVHNRFFEVLYYRHIGEPVEWQPIKPQAGGE
jgi:hypothetical protein